MLQQVKTYIPQSEFFIDTTSNMYVRAKENTLEAYQKNLQTLKKTQDRAITFQKDFSVYIKDISWESLNELIYILQKIARVKSDNKDEKAVKMRLLNIVESFKMNYIQQPLQFTQENSLMAYNSGKKAVIKTSLPLYVHLKAFLIVSQEMLSEYLSQSLNDLKMTYQTSKDSVVVFFSGNFNEEKIKQKLKEGIEGFKEMTIKIVNKGMEVKVDKESLIQNYDKFAVDFLKTVRQLREKSQDNIVEVKKKSKDLYNEVISRIKAKQLEIKTELRSMKNYSEQFDL